MNRVDNRTHNVTDDVKWIGILDHEIVSFDIVMETEYGTTYNSYFINAEKKAVIETAKEKFSETYLNKLRSVTDPSDIQYIIMNHTEPDHSGSLKHLLALAPEAVVVGSGNAIRYLNDMVGVPFKSLAVKDGDTLDLGNKTLRFVSAPNLHWPDSIYTYLEEDKLLFTCDSFGAHYCDEEMFDDKVEDYSEAFKYYFDVILKPFSRFMLKAIEKISQLEINTICPGHGPILRSSWKEKLELSRKYAEEYIELCSVNRVKNVLLMYISAYGYTREMAEIIKVGLEGVPDTKVTLLDIETIDLGDLESEIVKADGLLVGSPTINQNTLLPIYRLFAVINPLRDKGKHAAAFGSYGWSGEASGIIAGNLKNLKLNVMEELGKFKFSPDDEKRIELVSFGAKFASELAKCE